MSKMAGILFGFADEAPDPHGGTDSAPIRPHKFSRLTIKNGSGAPWELSPWATNSSGAKILYMPAFSLPPEGRRHKLNTHIYAAIAGRPLVIGPAQKISSGWYAVMSERLKRQFSKQMPLLNINAVKRLAEARLRIAQCQVSRTKPSSISSVDRLH